MENEIDRIFAKLDAVDSELRSLNTTMAKTEEQIKRLEYSEAQHTTELSNTRQLLGECSSSINYINSQLNSFSEQKESMLQVTSESKGNTGKLETFELLFTEKLRNVTSSIERVKEQLSFLIEKLQLIQAQNTEDIKNMKAELKGTRNSVIAALSTLLFWIVKQFGSAQGWW